MRRGFDLDISTAYDLKGFKISSNPDVSNSFHPEANYFDSRISSYIKACLSKNNLITDRTRLKFVTLENGYYNMEEYKALDTQFLCMAKHDGYRSTKISIFNIGYVSNGFDYDVSSKPVATIQDEKKQTNISYLNAQEIELLLSKIPHDVEIYYQLHALKIIKSSNERKDYSKISTILRNTIESIQPLLENKNIDFSFLEYLAESLEGQVGSIGLLPLIRFYVVNEFQKVLQSISIGNIELEAFHTEINKINQYLDQELLEISLSNS